jgi:ketosteroid isomerase-like protein
MSDVHQLADRFEIEALRGEYADAVMTKEYDRLGRLFTDGAVYRIPSGEVLRTGRDEIRTGLERLGREWEYLVQTVHPGIIEVDGDTAAGRAYVSELGRMHSGMSMYNYGVFHDRYQRTPDGWKFAEREYEVKYFDTTPLAGSPQVNLPTAADRRELS